MPRRRQRAARSVPESRAARTCGRSLTACKSPRTTQCRDHGSSAKPDPRVPKVDAPGEYRIRRLHRDGSRGIARFELVGKEGVDNVQRAEKAHQRCTENDENLSKHRTFLL